MIVNEDYKFRDDMKLDTVPIELLTDPFKGVILRYTTVAIQEKENGEARLKFDYELIEPGDHSMVSLRKNNIFQHHVGLILNAMILDSLEAPEDDTREHDIEESDNE